MSLTIGRCTTLFLLISEASMSMWTIVPCLANSLTLPVTRSSKRTPKASSRSALVHRPVRVGRAVHAEPAQRERMRLRKAPMPMSVVVTGICVRSANSRSSALALRR